MTKFDSFVTRKPKSDDVIPILFCCHPDQRGGIWLFRSLHSQSLGRDDNIGPAGESVIYWIYINKNIMGEPRDFGLTPKDQSIRSVESLDSKRKIIIRPEDIPGHLSEFRETCDDLLVCLDVDKGIWIHVGVPVVNKETDNKVIRIPSSPHVFMAHSLRAIDQDHPEGADFANVPVIFAHGGRRNGKWVFEDGQGVVDTVNAFDEYCTRNERNLPRVEFVLSCNKDTPSMVKVKDFQTHRPIVQAVGNVLFLNEAQMREGRVAVTVQTDKFWGLDDLRISKQIRVRRTEG